MIDMIDSFVTPIGQFVQRVEAGTMQPLDDLVLGVIAIGIIGFASSILGKIWR